MSNRRKFLQSSILGFGSLSILNRKVVAAVLDHTPVTGQPVVLSTWDTGVAANKGAWEVLGKNGNALDAVEAGVRVTESSINCCVGLGANPDRDGHVTLDASIMDHQWNCGSVAGVSGHR